METGYTKLGDSNYDWGHGLPELKRWNAEHNGGRPIAISYFGTDPGCLYEPFKVVNLYWDLKTESPDELKRLAGTRYLAVSTSALYGQETVKPSHVAALRRLRAATPVARTQTFLIFELE
jgi:hypothetical protein